MKSSLLRGLALSSLVAGVALFDPGRADACGGCFVQQTERTVVTDHRMALSVSQTQTVLWDQIRYSGDPAEFAWVLPVRAGAKLELSNDAFFTALDASTQPTVIAPPTYGGGYGCGLAGCGSQTTSADSAASAPGPGQVQIISQAVVGPYETVTLRATDPSALRKWLKSHAYDIPTTIEPTIDAYVAESFDFIALRLRPDCGERSMQPVRIVTQGADPTLPLRMVAAGVGARVGITLYVISEGRFQPQNFPHAIIDDAQVTWSRTQGKSNYQPLVESLMAAHDGRTWVSEYADKPELFTAYDPRYGGSRAPGYVPTGSGAVPGLADTYYSQCRSRYAPPASTGSATGSTTPPSGQSPFTSPCRNAADAGIDTPDASSGDASALSDAGDAGDAGDARDAGTLDLDAGADAGDDDGGALADGGDGGDGGASSDGGASDDGGSEPTTDPPGTGNGSSSYAECLYLDDIDVALRGLHPADVWVTRLRANLPANALGAGDLKLEAASDQTPLSNVHYAAGYDDETSAGTGARDACVSAPKRRTAFGSWVLAAVSAIAAVAFMRRRTRR
jgi:hypothetical protein